MASLRRLALSRRLARAKQVRVRVVVIGNLYVGGTGKTPLAIELARALARPWLVPGVISRGSEPSAGCRVSWYRTAARLTTATSRF